MIFVHKLDSYQWEMTCYTFLSFTPNFNDPLQYFVIIYTRVTRHSVTRPIAFVMCIMSMCMLVPSCRSETAIDASLCRRMLSLLCIVVISFNLFRNIITATSPRLTSAVTPVNMPSKLQIHVFIYLSPDYVAVMQDLSFL